MPAIGFDAQVFRGGRGHPNSVANSIGKDFFDRAAIEAMMDKKTASALSRFGYFVMRDARQSLRRRKSPSKPGQPPAVWSGNGDNFLLRMIYFFFDRYRRTVIVGPALLAGAHKGGDPVPQVLEEGGLVSKHGRIRTSRIAPRPYMNPAFQRQIQKQAAKLYQAGIFLGGLD